MTQEMDYQTTTEEATTTAREMLAPSQEKAGATTTGIRLGTTAHLMCDPDSIKTLAAVVARDVNAATRALVASAAKRDGALAALVTYRDGALALVQLPGKGDKSATEVVVLFQ